MTGKRLAELSGYAASYISEIEHNKTTPTVVTLENLAKALNVPIAVLMDTDFYYPYISQEGLKVSDSKITLDNDIFNELKALWLDVVKNWDVEDVEELIVYLETKKQVRERRKSK